MTQPPGWPPQPPQDGPGGPQQPPQDGYGYPQQPSPQPPYPGPYSPPPQQQPPGQAPGQAPNPYATQQPPPPYGAPPQPPYGAQPQPPYGAPYGGYPPQPPTGGGRGKGKLALVIGAAVAAVVLIGGGIYLVTSGGDGGDGKPLSDKSVSAQPSASSATDDAEAADDTEEPSVDTSDASDPATDDTYGDDDESVTAPATGFKGQWQDDDNKTLTVGSKYTSGEYKGKYALSYIDAGGKGILTGLGMDRSDGSFRMVLAPMGSEDEDDYTAATLSRSGDSVVIKWDDGGSDTLAYVGESDS